MRNEKVYEIALWKGLGQYISSSPENLSAQEVLDRLKKGQLEDPNDPDNDDLDIQLWEAVEYHNPKEVAEWVEAGANATLDAFVELAQEMRNSLNDDRLQEYTPQELENWVRTGSIFPNKPSSDLTKLGLRPIENCPISDMKNITIKHASGPESTFQDETKLSKFLGQLLHKDDDRLFETRDLLDEAEYKVIRAELRDIAPYYEVYSGHGTFWVTKAGYVVKTEITCDCADECQMRSIIWFNMDEWSWFHGVPLDERRGFDILELQGEQIDGSTTPASSKRISMAHVEEK